MAHGAQNGVETQYSASLPGRPVFMPCHRGATFSCHAHVVDFHLEFLPGFNAYLAINGTIAIETIHNNNKPVTSGAIGWAKLKVIPIHSCLLRTSSLLSSGL